MNFIELNYTRINLDLIVSYEKNTNVYKKPIIHFRDNQNFFDIMFDSNYECDRALAELDSVTKTYCPTLSKPRTYEDP